MSLAQWSDTSAYSDANQNGLLILQTAVPVGDNVISDQDLALLEEQSKSQALVIQQARGKAAKEVEMIESEKPRPISEEAPPKVRKEWEKAMGIWRKRMASAKQTVEAEREVYMFSMAVVGAETLAQAAVKIAVEAYQAGNWRAFHGEWGEWCEMAMTEIQRLGKRTNRKMADKTLLNMGTRITHYLPAFMNMLGESKTLELGDGTQVTPQWLADNPGFLNEAGSLVKGMAENQEEGGRDAFKQIVEGFSTMTQRDFRKTFSSSNQYTEKPEKKQLVKETIQEVDGETGEVKVRARYIAYADSTAEEEWVETQLKARYEVVIPFPAINQEVPIEA